MSFENVQTKRHYTPLERNIFLDVLCKQKHVIENKKSDAFNLKEKAVAWAKVAKEYNSSESITQERSVIQLKKLWANLKQGKRNSLTKEKQSCLASDGDPAKPPAEIANIASNLVTTLPAEFSSNIKLVSQNDMNNQIRVEPIPCAGIRMDKADPLQPSTSKAAFQDMDLQKIDRSEKELLSTSKSPAAKTAAELFNCTLSPSQVMESPPVKKARLTSCGRSTVTNSLHSCEVHEKELREERVRRLIAYDDELAGIRRTQEIRLGEMKEMHMKKIYDLEIQTAQAKLELIELELQLTKRYLRLGQSSGLKFLTHRSKFL